VSCEEHLDNNFIRLRIIHYRHFYIQKLTGGRVHPIFHRGTKQRVKEQLSKIQVYVFKQ